MVHGEVRYTGQIPLTSPKRAPVHSGVGVTRQWGAKSTIRSVSVTNKRIRVDACLHIVLTEYPWVASNRLPPALNLILIYNQRRPIGLGNRIPIRCDPICKILPD